MGEGNKKIMWISGRCGYGKTEFANSIIQKFEGKNKKTCKLDVKDFIDFLIKNIKSQNPIEDVVSYFQDYSLLVLDNIDYGLLRMSITQKAMKETIHKITNNNKTTTILISQKRARKVKKLKFNSNECSYLRLKAPSIDIKRSLIEGWSKKEGFNIPIEKIEEVINKSDNLFQLKGLFNKIKFSRKVKVN